MKQKRKDFVAYYRVSTAKQNIEMPAQKTAVKNYLKAFWPPVASFTEIESGKNSARPELQKAIEFCKDNKATLVVAKLDRLSRDLSFIAHLQDDLDFVCADMPHATRETIGIMGVLARWEREQLSKRTKEALAELKKHGVKLGYNHPKVKAGVKRYNKLRKAQATKKRKALLKERKLRREKIKRERAKQGLYYSYKPVGPGQSQRELFDKKVLPIIQTMRGQGFSYEKTALAMAKAKIATRQGGGWSAVQVERIEKRNTK